MASNAFIIVSLARSGSNQLVEYINQVSSCVCYGEIFKSQAPQEAYWEKLSKFFESKEQAEELHASDLVGFWSKVVANQPAAVDQVGAKIFYYHREGDPIWDYIYSGEIPLIHLWRDSIFSSYVSLIRAEQSGQWSMRPGEKGTTGDTKVRFDVDRYGKYRQLVLSQYGQAERRMADCEKVLSLEYGQIEQVDVMSELLDGFLSRSVELKQTLVKQSMKLPIDYIENVEDAEPFMDDLISNSFAVTLR